MNTNKWYRPRHVFYCFLGKEVLKRYLKVKMGFVREKEKLPKGPGIIISNHTTNYDPFMIAMNAKRLIYFVVASDAFSNKRVGRLIDYSCRPIRKIKGMNDLVCVKNMFKVLKEGYKIGLFPEGNRSFSGETVKIDDSIAKFIKKANVPVYIYNIEGGYNSEPRWGYVNKGEVHARIKRTLSVEEIKNMDVHTLYELIVDSLNVDTHEYPLKDKVENVALGLERALYVCPDCKKFNTMKSDGREFYCTECGYKLSLSNDFYFTKLKGNTDFKDIKDYYQFELNFINEYVPQEGIIYTDNNLNIIKRVNGIVKRREKNVTLSIDRSNVYISLKTEMKTIPLKEILAVSIFLRSNLSLHLADTVYVFKSKDMFCALKYMHLYNRLKNIESNNNSKDLGL